MLKGGISKKEIVTRAPVSDLHRWALASIMVATIVFGWHWPVLGYTVPVAMGVGIGGAFLRGRYVCGNICPRGSFYDTFFRILGGNRTVPAFFTTMQFRWGAAVILMSLMALQIAQNPTDPFHWGRVFWFVCAATTAVGVTLGLFYNPRAWCSFCPVGTMANAIGGHNDPLMINDSCKSCGLCEKSCPMNLTIASHKSAGALPHRDCLKCSSCVDICPINALSFEGERARQLDCPGGGAC